MNVDDALKFSEHPGLFTLMLFIALIFGSPAILSEKAAEKFGLFGALARALRDQKQKAVEASRLSHDDELKDLTDRFNRFVDRYNDDIAKLRLELDTVQKQDDLKYRYILYITDVMRGWVIWGAEQGIKFPGEWLTYRAWVQREKDTDNF